MRFILLFILSVSASAAPYCQPNHYLFALNESQPYVSDCSPLDGNQYKCCVPTPARKALENACKKTGGNLAAEQGHNGVNCKQVNASYKCCYNDDVWYRMPGNHVEPPTYPRPEPGCRIEQVCVRQDKCGNYCGDPSRMSVSCSESYVCH